MLHSAVPVSKCVKTTEKDIDDWCFEYKDRSSEVLTGFIKLYEGNCLTDIVLCAEKKKFPCHKALLAASSPYFMGMFSSNMAESQQSEVELKSISPLTLKLILEFIYKGKVVISVDTVQDVLSASNMFQLIALRDGCADFMMKRLNVTNCIGVYFFACTHMCNTLAKNAKELINDQIVLVCNNQEFLELPVDKVAQILDDDRLNVSDEKQVYEACLSWLKYDITSRKSKVFEVMSCVRFANIAPSYLWDSVKTNLLVSECDDLKEVLNTVDYYHAIKTRQLEMDLNFMPRRGMPCRRAVLIFTYNFKEKVSVVEEIDFDYNTLSLVCQLPKQCFFRPACAVTGDNLVYVAGGFAQPSMYKTAYRFSNSLCVFDPTSRSWREKASMDMARAMFPLTVLDSYIFAVGGKSGSDIVATVEKYDIEKNVWRNVAPLLEPVCDSCSVGYKGKLYVFGGKTAGDNMVKHSLRYDPCSDQWTSLSDMSSPKSLMGVVVYKDQFYVIGGLKVVSDKREYTNQVDIYDPATDTWSKGPNLPLALKLSGTVKYNNKILVVSERDNKRNLSARTFLLSPDGTGELYWTEAHELPTTRTICDCVVANIPRVTEQKFLSFW